MTCGGSSWTYGADGAGLSPLQLCHQPVSPNNRAKAVRQPAAVKGVLLTHAMCAVEGVRAKPPLIRYSRQPEVPDTVTTLWQRVL